MKNNKNYLLKKAEKAILIQSIIMIILLFSILLIKKETLYLSVLVKVSIGENILFALYLYQKIWKPMHELNKVYKVFAEGYMVHDIFTQPYALTQENEAMMKRMNEILDRKEMFQVSKKQAEYLALQNQINPHFLYNTLEGIRSEALIGGMNSVAEMAEALARFFRYTISNLNTLVTVEDELNNVRNYCLIQKFRFGDKIRLEIEYADGEEKEITRVKMPKLILQPIVENAIQHGIEPLMGEGIINIRFQLVTDKLIIFLSDNGVGMKEDVLKHLNEQLKGPQLEEEEVKSHAGGIAMGNVNTRIKLIFGDAYGIHFYSTQNAGTDVEITLPCQWDDKVVA